MIKAPSTYAQWLDVLDLLKNDHNDENVLQALQAGTLAWQSGVAERFSQQLIDTVNARMDRASDLFQKNMERARGQEGTIIQSLIKLRRDMEFLKKVINLPAIPEEQRTVYVSLVTEQMQKMQESLLVSAQKDRSGKLASILRQHPLCR